MMATLAETIPMVYGEYRLENVVLPENCFDNVRRAKQPLSEVLLLQPPCVRPPEYRGYDIPDEAAILHISHSREEALMAQPYQEQITFGG
jgi:hypothetical protein